MGGLPPSIASLDLVEATWREHPYLAEDRTHWRLVRGWSGPAAVLLDVRPDSGGTALVGLGDPAVVGTWLDALARRPDGPRPQRAALPRGTWDQVRPTTRHRLGLEVSSTWDWLVCDGPPPEDVRPRSGAVVALDGDDERREAVAVVAGANPGTRASPADPRLRWWGWRDEDGALRAVLGCRRAHPDAPLHLTGIGTDPGFRGRGIASALTAAVVRHGLTEAPWVSLGVRTGNDVALAVYERLGFRVVGRFETVRVA